MRVRLFASLREAVGKAELSLELCDGARVADAWAALRGRHPDLEMRRKGLLAAVNRRYADFEDPLRAGDEVVFLPPVSGG